MKPTVILMCILVAISAVSAVPDWCPRGSPRIWCLVNPCTVKRCPGVPRAWCRNDNPCEPDCFGNFYFGPFRVPDRFCYPLEY